MSSELKSKARTVFVWIGVFATLSGAIAGLSSLWSLWDDSSKKASIDMPWVQTTTRVTVTPESFLESHELIADEIRVESGEYQFERPIHWVSNRVSLAQGAIVNVNDATIVSKEILGGYIRADGSFGEPHGDDGGSIKLAFQKRLSTTLSADGGNGRLGNRGGNGSDGRNGRCDGFGKWRSARIGTNGSDGGRGGNGGSGGNVLVIGPSPELNLIPEVSVQGGVAGSGGRGGTGGRGGRGCTGLGGSQSSASDGFPGSNGRPGINGTAGKFQAIAIEADELGERLEPILDHGVVHDIWSSLID